MITDDFSRGYCNSKQDLLNDFQLSKFGFSFSFKLNELIKLSLTKKEKTAPIVFHSDQGAVFSSRAFFKAHEQYTIQRSMSRIGTPTDNPVIEALNGWMKEELLTDFGLADTSDVRKLLDEYVEYYNHQRPAAALQYKSPIQFKHEQGF